MKRFVQFIAGAVCPKCKTKDTIALNPSDDKIYCVKCDFEESRPQEKTNNKIEEIKVVNLQDFKRNKDKKR